jgi:hypothetical protein
MMILISNIIIFQEKTATSDENQQSKLSFLEQQIAKYKLFFQLIQTALVVQFNARYIFIARLG